MAELDILIQKNNKLISFLESHRKGHYYCEDGWYSCPKAEDGCSDDSQGEECNCGAEDYNKMIEELIEECKHG